MSKFSNKLLIFALLSAFAATTTGSAVAAEKERGKNKQERSAEGRHDENQLAKLAVSTMTVKTSVLTVTNRGGGPLTITAAPAINRLSGNGSFAIVASGTGTPCAASLVVAPGGGTCTIGVQYTPAGGGVSTARLTLADSGAETTTQETVIRAE